ncbi:MAG TPA: response regulator transcription factor [Pyrinomonadaceae bacterium]|nr:response regulator transcription factor [Pyrinomonadaceae bacterium]
MTATAQKKTRIVIADDHGTMREGLRLLLNSQPDLEVVGEAGDGREAIQLACQLAPDVLLMDISMPGMNGLDATKKLKEQCPNVRVLTLTRHTDDGFLKQLLAAGASGYALKLSSADDLMRAIRTVSTGGTYIDPAVAGKLVSSAARSTHKTGPMPRVDLTEREEEVLRMIAWGHSNKEIASRLNLSVKTIEAHKANAMQKLNMTGRIDIVRYAVLRGWLNDSDGQ